MLRSIKSEVVWDYSEAFKRNRGLIRLEEQFHLKQVCIAVAGLGGVGGVNLMTLARLGIGRFHIADPDTFEISNTNRQYGASLRTFGQSKAEVMAQQIYDINPEAEIKIFKDPITENNIEDFLSGAEVLVDSIDAFAIHTKRLLFQKAKEKGIWGLGAGPVGFSTAWVIFDPQGMSYDDYFDFQDNQNHKDQFIAYILGMAPKATQHSYTDSSFLNIASHTGPSVASACQLAAGVIGTEVLKILLNRGKIKCAPWFHQFDPFVIQYATGQLRFGNKGFLQKIKRKFAVKFLSKNYESFSKTNP